MLEHLTAGRTMAESLMADTFTAFEPTAATTGPDGLKVAAFIDRGATPGKVQSPSRQGDTQTRYVSVGHIERPILAGGLHIPISATLPSPGWEYECTAVGAASDPSLLGRRWRVVEVPAKSYATARRLDVVEV